MSDRILQELPGWSLAWSDEFDGAAGSPVDPASWQPEVGGHGWGNQELQYYTDSRDNVRLDGAGNFQIVVRCSDPQLRDHRFGGCLYTSARLITKDRVAFTYGLVQARIRLPQGRGIWPALWMLGPEHRPGRLAAMWRDRRHGELRQGPRPSSTARFMARATQAPGASSPPTGLPPASPTTSTCTRSTGSPTGSAGTWTTSSTARDARRPPGQPLGLRPRLLPAPECGRGRDLLGHARPVGNLPPGHAGRLHPYLRQRTWRSVLSLRPERERHRPSAVPARPPVLSLPRWSRSAAISPVRGGYLSRPVT